ncbi:hypothetical protein GJ744_006500 [Endocarpon pusillum]|uniref:Uncharacterized protein n=1 Tax=Endocarpon pusillum TaxID=364733 RepID=A0A8H7AVF6_9EURO|nr:hypothetical protein GJ744_006500 [Endocarpon pusillum]
MRTKALFTPPVELFSFIPWSTSAPPRRPRDTQGDLVEAKLLGLRIPHLRAWHPPAFPMSRASTRASLDGAGIVKGDWILRP